jgi:arsenate reductase
MEIWINPACTKCRIALADLDAAGVDYTVRRYLDDPPSRAELEGVLAALGLEPWDIARQKEAAEEGLAFPRAIQRPIITAADGTTVVGRDPDSVARAIAHERG